MTTSNSELPAYEELRATGQVVTPSIDFLRLRWYFNGPIEASIHVLEDATDPTSSQTPYRTTITTTSPDGQTHQIIQEHGISSSSISAKPISSIKVTILMLDDWECAWEEAHEPEENESAVYTEDGPEGERKLIQCCGEGRPYYKSSPPSCLVKASGKSKPFVTIHDYVTAVHPWMAALEDDIRCAKGVHKGTPIRKSANMFMWNCLLSPLLIQDDLGQNPAAIAAHWKRTASLASEIRDGTLNAQ
ncbi:hypothetical protein GGS26DRAFT_557401 [Hypomontagnella submonticulosa]|nr:hypothetical protein GGS26DRAFT_557401 [Hypomontagnella submonticulosa]